MALVAVNRLKQSHVLLVACLKARNRTNVASMMSGAQGKEQKMGVQMLLKQLPCMNYLL